MAIRGVLLLGFVAWGEAVFLLQQAAGLVFSKHTAQLVPVGFDGKAGHGYARYQPLQNHTASAGIKVSRCGRREAQQKGDE